MNIKDQSKSIRYFTLNVISIGLLILALLFFILSFSKPYSGVYLSFQGGAWFVESVDSNGVAADKGIQIGDRVISVNGQDASSYLQRYAETVKLVTGSLITSLETIDNTGRMSHFDIENDKSPTRTQLELGMWFLVSSIFWIVGFFVYRKRPNDQVSIILLFCSLSFGLALGANMASERAISSAFNSAVIAATLGPWLLLHFFLVLPEERRRLRSTFLIFLIYTPAIIILLLYPFIGFADGQTLQGFRLIRLAGYGVGFLAVAIVVVLNFLRANSLRTRQQMKIIMAGGLLAVVPFIALNILPVTVEGNIIMPASFGMLFFAFIPLSMGYAILTQKLMDIDIHIRRGAIYGLITLVIALVLVIAMSVVFRFRTPMGTYETVLFSILLGALATALFGPVKNWSEKVVDRFFFKDSHDYRAIAQELNMSLGRLNDVDKAGTIIVDIVVKTLKIKGASLFVGVGQNKYETVTSKGSQRDTAKLLETSMMLNSQSITKDGPTKEVLKSGTRVLSVPLCTGDRALGYLILDDREDGQDFALAQQLFIQSVASLAAVNLRSMMINAEAVEARRRYDEALRNAAEEWRITFDSITDMIAIVGADHRIVKVNTAFADSFGGQPREFIGRFCHEAVHDLPELKAHCSLTKVLATRETTRHELFEPKIGKYLECVISPLIDDLGNIKGVVHIFKDITGRKKMEEEQENLRNRAEVSSRLATIGEMAAGIAHEINNPLTGVIGFAHLLLHEKLPEDIKEQVEFIARDSDRIKTIVSRMLSIARQSKPCKSLFDIHEILEATLELRRYTHESSGINVVKEFDYQLPWIYGDPGQLQQVVSRQVV